MRRFLFAALLLLLAPSLRAQNADAPHYPVVAFEDVPGVIGILGPIDARTPFAFEVVLSQIDTPKVLVLDSPGGNVTSALAIAYKVKALGLETVILPERGCYSACAYIFLAGATRTAEGELGVHQISNGSAAPDSLEAGQYALADIYDTLVAFGTPQEVISAMLRTPPEDMYVFSVQEKQSFGFLGAAATAPQPPAPVPAPAPSGPETWSGFTVHGALADSGKKWFIWLRENGRMTFQFTSGERRHGRYRTGNGVFCFLFDGEVKEACRYPIERGSTTYWYTEKGEYSSIILGTSQTPPSQIDPQINLPRSVAQHIPPGECALIVASRQTVTEAKRYVAEHIENTDFLMGYRSQNGRIAISIGTLKPNEVDPVMRRWKASGRIPADSFCTTGTKLTGLVPLK